MPSDSAVRVFTRGQQAMIETVWSNALVQIQDGSSEIVVTASTRESIGQQGIMAIADRFR